MDFSRINNNFNFINYDLNSVGENFQEILENQYPQEAVNVDFNSTNDIGDEEEVNYNDLLNYFLENGEQINSTFNENFLKETYQDFNSTNDIGDEEEVNYNDLLNYFLENEKQTNLALSNKNPLKRTSEFFNPSIHSFKRNRNESDSVSFDQEYQKIKEEFLQTGKLPERIDGMIKDLLPYQWHGVKWMENLTKNSLGGVLGDEMGLGKTFQAIGLIQILLNKAKKENRPFHALVVCPANLVDNWKNEFTKNAPGLDFYLNKENNENIQIQIVSAEYLRNEQNRKKIEDKIWDVTFVDEVHGFVNGSSSKKLLKFLQIRSTGFFGLTGTPFMNELKELDTLVLLFSKSPRKAMIARKVYDNAKKLIKSLIHDKIIENDRIKKNSSSDEFLEKREEKIVELIEITQSIRNTLRSHILRRKKTESDISSQLIKSGLKKDDQEGNVKKISYPFSPVQEKIIQVKSEDLTSIEKKANASLDVFRSSSSSKGYGVNIHTILSQVANGIDLLSSKTKENLKKHPELKNIFEEKPETSLKLIKVKNQIFNILKENPEDKILVFTNFRKVAEKIKKLVQNEFSEKNKKNKAIYLSSDEKMENRDKILSRFHQKSHYKVLILTRSIGHVGLNITGANHVLMVDNWWNQQDTDQCIARCDRIGQKKLIHVYEMFNPNFLGDTQLQKYKEEKTLWAHILLDETKKEELKERFETIFA